jgi:hypothetical protein
MKYIITESKLENVAIKYLNKVYGDLEEYKTDEHPDSVFFVKDKKIYMEQDLENDDLWIDYYTIWKDLRNTFLLEDNEIKSIISKWVEETYKLRGVTPIDMSFEHHNRWKRLIN